MPCTVTVNLDTFYQNVLYIKNEWLGGGCSESHQTLLCIVLKSNAYGHGIHKLAPVAIAAGANVLGIATNMDASSARHACCSQEGQKDDDVVRIMRLRTASQSELREALTHILRVEEMVGSLATAKAISALALKHSDNTVVDVHINLDCGMGRMGFLPEQRDDVQYLLNHGLKGLHIVGVLGHFPSAAADSIEQTHKAIQNFRTNWVDSKIVPKSIRIGLANSSATQRCPELRGQDGEGLMMVRCGAASYGNRTGGPMLPTELRPVMSVTTEIVRLALYPPGVPIGYGSTFTTERKPFTRVATIPMGFAEGYPRALSNEGEAIVGGRRCPILGMISMNVITIDVTAVEDACVGDPVLLFGSQDGVSITFEDMTERFGGVPYEIQLPLGALNSIQYVDVSPSSIRTKRGTTTMHAETDVTTSMGWSQYIWNWLVNP